MNIIQRLILTVGLAIKALGLKLFLCGSLGELTSIRETSDLLTALAKQERTIKAKMSVLAQDPDDYEVMAVGLSSVTSWIEYLHCIERIRDLWH